MRASVFSSGYFCNATACINENRVDSDILSSVVGPVVVLVEPAARNVVRLARRANFAARSVPVESRDEEHPINSSTFDAVQQCFVVSSSSFTDRFVILHRCRAANFLFVLALLLRKARVTAKHSHA
jgi:hypothetical protein